MDQQKIDRINALAHKAKTIGLTEAETAERDYLRREYVASVVGNLTAQLDNTYVVDDRGRKKKLQRKD